MSLVRLLWSKIRQSFHIKKGTIHLLCIFSPVAFIWLVGKKKQTLNDIFLEGENYIRYNSFVFLLLLQRFR